MNSPTICYKLLCTRPQMKRRRLHWDSLQCIEYAATKEGASPLLNPTELSCDLHKLNHKLQPANKNCQKDAFHSQKKFIACNSSTPLSSPIKTVPSYPSTSVSSQCYPNSSVSSPAKTVPSYPSTSVSSQRYPHSSVSSPIKIVPSYPRTSVSSQCYPNSSVSSPAKAVPSYPSTSVSSPVKAVPSYPSTSVSSPVKAASSYPSKSVSSPVKAVPSYPSTSVSLGAKAVPSYPSTSVSSQRYPNSSVSSPIKTVPSYPSTSVSLGAKAVPSYPSTSVSSQRYPNSSVSSPIKTVPSYPSTSVSSPVKAASSYPSKSVSSPAKTVPSYPSTSVSSPVKAASSYPSKSVSSPAKTVPSYPSTSVSLGAKAVPSYPSTSVSSQHYPNSSVSSPIKTVPSYPSTSVSSQHYPNSSVSSPAKTVPSYPSTSVSSPQDIVQPFSQLKKYNFFGFFRASSLITENSESSGNIRKKCDEKIKCVQRKFTSSSLEENPFLIQPIGLPRRFKERSFERNLSGTDVSQNDLAAPSIKFNSINTKKCNKKKSRSKTYQKNTLKNYIQLFPVKDTVKLNTSIDRRNEGHFVGQNKSSLPCQFKSEGLSSLDNSHTPTRKSIVFENSDSDHAYLVSGDSQTFPYIKERNYNRKNILVNDKLCQDTYGLLGTEDAVYRLAAEAEDAVDSARFQGIDYFALLPVHCFELILCRLPVLDLFLNLTKVNKYWNQVISNKHFIPWKKIYYRLKTNSDAGVKVQIKAICEKYEMNSVKHCIMGLIRYMRNFRQCASSEAISFLQHHEKIKWVLEFLEEREPQLVLNLWSIITTLTVISETVWDVYNIIQYLLHPKSQCTVPDVLECLYCIGSFLLHFKNKYKINHGLHYRLFYALHIYENLWSGTTCDMTALQEQFPGQQSILKYGSVNELAKKTFPPNVECRTAHSLAWEGIGKYYRRKLTSKLRPIDIMSKLYKAPKTYAKKQRYASAVLATINSFMATVDDDITVAHVPQHLVDWDGETLQLIGDTERLAVADDAQGLWNKMANQSDNEVYITHDVYLKLYQLTHPRLEGYDCILVDEAQDCNGAMLDLLLSQPCPKILVGDPNQQIYAFRGAVNALNSVQSSQMFYLTRSFRFGPEISYVASCALEVLKKIHNKTIVGGTQEGAVNGSKVGQICIIARCNLTLLNEAVRLCCGEERYEGEPSTVRGAFVGGLKGYGLEQIVDMYRLMTINRDISPEDLQDIKDKFIRGFKRMEHLYEYAKNTSDVELLNKIRFVRQHRERIPEYVETIKTKCTFPMYMANVVFTTAHKSKGLEFNTVCLKDDFTIDNIPYQEPSQMTPELENEFNLLYVAISRAKKRLCFPTSVYYLLLGAQEKFEYPVYLKNLVDDQLPCRLECVSCKDQFESRNVLLLVRRPFRTANNRLIPGGPICPTCITKSEYTPLFPHPNLGRVNSGRITDNARQSLSYLVGSLTSQTREGTK
ncbi:F-box DNA helicase 1-like isoform X3 [Tachypleus tridentatus]|uniref:F-box DNA helicase 1-like isoform X3 n=1 Tax=Tachypleus tridentatus TaxID=6853 RepID=UPI003FD22DBF